MKKITFAFSIMLLAIIIASCKSQSKEEKASELVKTFWKYAKEKSDSTYSIYPDYTDPLSPVSISDYAKIGDLSITSCEAIPNSDSCVVLCTNSYYDDNSGELQQNRVKFYVCQNQILSSYGLLTLPAKVKVLLKKAGYPCSGNDFYDKYLAKDNEEIAAFVKFIDTYCGGEDVLSKNFKGDEYAQFGTACNFAQFDPSTQSKLLKALIEQILTE